MHRRARRPSSWWEWDLDGRRAAQFLAAEEEFAAYVETVLRNLVRIGATGAMLWCFADYDRALWDQPPCDATARSTSASSGSSAQTAR